MIKEDEILKLEEKIKSTKAKIRNTNSTLLKAEYEADLNLIFWIIETLKNLNGATVKLREVCPRCKSKLIAYDYESKWFYYNCLNKWGHE